MAFNENPMLFQELLFRAGLDDHIYKPIKEMDMPGAVMAALKILKTTTSLPRINKEKKDIHKSSVFRKTGNDFFVNKDYRKALACYNNALLFAPEGSTEMSLAFSNRSALLFQINAFTACVKDIETCLTYNCSTELIKKLNKRMKQCQANQWKDNLKNGVMKSNFKLNFFKFNVERHMDLPCASTDIRIISDCGEKKVVAARDIPVGTLVAIDTSYVMQFDKEEEYFTCHYCHKLSFNLIPCDGCCYTLFCDDDCKKRCVREYHNIECEMIETLRELNIDGSLRLTVKAVLKLKNLSNWNDLIRESKVIGESRLKTCPVNEMYDVNNKLSILSFTEEKYFVHGEIYNNSFMYATIIHCLQNIDGFFPSDHKKNVEAVKCLSTLFMVLDMQWSHKIPVVNAAEGYATGQLLASAAVHLGWLPFAGKLRHNCDPNLLALGLKDKVALVAAKPIAKGMELNISHVGHWYDIEHYKLRAKKMFTSIHKICSCRVCKGEWGAKTLIKDSLNRSERNIFEHWDNRRRNMSHRDEFEYFRMTCNTLTGLKGKENTKEHYEVFREFTAHLGLLQIVATDNVIL